MMELENNTYINNIINFDKKYDIKVLGTVDKPWFCGKDVAIVLGYKDTKSALLKIVPAKYKSTYECVLNNLGGGYSGCNLHISYNEGKAVYISEPGLYELYL